MNAAELTFYGLLWIVMALAAVLECLGLRLLWEEYERKHPRPSCDPAEESLFFKRELDHIRGLTVGEAEDLLTPIKSRFSNGNPEVAWKVLSINYEPLSEHEQIRLSWIAFNKKGGLNAS